MGVICCDVEIGDGAGKVIGGEIIGPFEFVDTNGVFGVCGGGGGDILSWVTDLELDCCGLCCCSFSSLTFD